MIKSSKQLLLASSITLAMLATSGIATADTQDITEARQETQIWTTYALSPYLRASDITVSVDNGKATLTGKADEEVNKDLAKQIALGVKGIKEVDNKIIVTEGYVPLKSSTERGYGEVIDDASITTAIRSKLIWSKHTNSVNTEITTNSGKVVLRGQADNQKSKDTATRLALNTRGVVSVDNQLTVKGENANIADKAKIQADKAEQNVSDSWITTKVKSTLLYSSNVTGSNIEVSTKYGIVTLEGKVNSGAESALAIELADNVRGVKSVNSKKLTF